LAELELEDFGQAEVGLQGPLELFGGVEKVLIQVPLEVPILAQATTAQDQQRLGPERHQEKELVRARLLQPRLVLG
jgi:hypothetical protein